MRTACACLEAWECFAPETRAPNASMLQQFAVGAPPYATAARRTGMFDHYRVLEAGRTVARAWATQGSTV